MRGSIKKIGKNKYRLVYDLPPMLVDGELVRKQKKEVFNGTKVQAEDYLADIITKIKSGLYINDTGKTVAEYLRETKLNLFYFTLHTETLKTLPNPCRCGI